MIAREISKIIAKPRRDAYPSPMWLWNDHLSIPKLRKEVDRFARWGLKSFIVHPMPDDFRKSDFFHGMTTRYLSPRYFDCFRATVERAAGHGMQVWIYDDGGWPSGLANGLLVQQHPELQAQVMTPKGVRPVADRSDLLHPETAKLFIEITHEKYREAVGEYFGTTIPGVFTDEPSVPGETGSRRLPWTGDMPRHYLERTGRSIEEDLTTLMSTSAQPKECRIRREYTHLWSRLFLEHFFSPIRKWCRRHRLKLVGHLIGDQSIDAATRYNGIYHEVIRGLDEPGIDVIWGQVDTKRPRSFFPGFAASAVNKKSQKCWSESFSVYGFGLTVAEMKLLCDYQLLQGVNKFTPMYLQLSSRGGRGICTATRQLDEAPDARAYPLLDTYLARMGQLFTEAEVYRPIRLPFPDAELAEYPDAKLRDRFNRLAGRLLDNNIAFRFDHEAAWRSSTACERKFWKDWPFKARPHSNPALRWIAFRHRGKAWLFALNLSARRARLELSPSGHEYDFTPRESRLISLDEPHSDTQWSKAISLKNWEIAPREAWNFDGEAWVQQNLSRSDFQKTSLCSWRKIIDPDFSGTAVYRCTFSWKAAPAKVCLDLGQVQSQAEVSLNKKSVGIQAWSPYRFDLTPHIASGNNLLEIRVSGSLANQICSPRAIAAMKAKGHFNAYMKKAMPLENQRLDNGLMGPVRLLIS